MKLQKASLIGLYAVLELASNPKKQLSTGEIADKYGVSNHHLAKVMPPLVRAGLAKSVRGAGGGYRFSGNAARTTLMDIIELFEPFDPTLDAREKNTAVETNVGWALQEVYEEIDELAKATLMSITLKSLLKIASSRTARTAEAMA
jgi:Rrf2 family protein